MVSIDRLVRTETIQAYDDICRGMLLLVIDIGRNCKLTRELRRQCFVVCNADKSFQAHMFKHELPLCEELSREGVEQAGFDISAAATQIAEFRSSEMRGDAHDEFRGQAQESAARCHEEDVVKGR